MTDEEWARLYQDYIYERRMDLKQIKNTIIEAIIELKTDLEEII